MSANSERTDVPVAVIWSAIIDILSFDSCGCKPFSAPLL
jgi:hypothetical protein